MKVFVKRKLWVYISADYAEDSGDREVTAMLNNWAADDIHDLDFFDTAQAKGSVSNDPDCRSCELKSEFNQRINDSDYFIVIIGDKTRLRTAGSGCERYMKDCNECYCTPYKQNTNGQKPCKVKSTSPANGGDVGSINSYSYLQHEFEQAKRKNKPIIVLYNSLNHQKDWLPNYMKEFENSAQPFWIKNANGDKVGNYNLVKNALRFNR